MSWTVTYYETTSGVRPVLGYIDALSGKEASSVVRAIQRLEQFGVGLGMPHVRPLQGKLWELRSHGPTQQHRVIYVATSSESLLLLHAFTKKTAQTPRREIQLAEERLTDWERRQQKRGKR